MSDKRYPVFYTGRLKPGMDKATVMSNLVLSLGISETKAKRLLDSERQMLKRCASAVDAQVLVDKFDQAGIVCIVGGGMEENPGMEAGGESSLVRMLKQVSPASGGESPSLIKRLVGGGLRRRRA